ncbi:hypothetical protein B296_00011193 [Ensete ventricosum]|uniref:Uncharacterized protein n=1 Tax=Ensete ventricosum TaxID=4639 RepID=A0A427AXQ7_ENSVE|nr:hypothetical protein B296_00011193 [Ensete ventricosum]
MMLRTAQNWMMSDAVPHACSAHVRACAVVVVVVVPKQTPAPYPVASYCVRGSDDGFGARTMSSGTFVRLCCRSASRESSIADAMPHATAASISGVEGAKRWTGRAAFIARKSLPGCFQLCRCVRSLKLK